jgi:hypothetical protein
VDVNNQINTTKLLFTSYSLSCLAVSCPAAGCSLCQDSRLPTPGLSFDPALHCIYLQVQISAWFYGTLQIRAPTHLTLLWRRDSQDTAPQKAQTTQQQHTSSHTQLGF